MENSTTEQVKLSKPNELQEEKQRLLNQIEEHEKNIQFAYDTIESEKDKIYWLKKRIKPLDEQMGIKPKKKSSAETLVDISKNLK